MSNQIHDRQLEATNSLIEQVRHQSRLLNEIHATQRSAARYDQEYFAAQSRLLEDISNKAIEQTNSLQALQRADYHAQQTHSSPSSSSDTSRPSHSLSIIGVRARVATDFIVSRRQFVCPSACRCSCHTSKSFRTPRLFNKAIGTLFVGYSGYPSGFARCADGKCQAGLSAHITYIFPFWLLQKMIDICLAVSKVQDPYLNITVRALVPTGAEIFRLTRANDRVGLERLFSSGGARPNDLSQVSERHALEVYTSFLVCTMS